MRLKINFNSINNLIKKYKLKENWPNPKKTIDKMTTAKF